jgi:hypothetical protein
MTLRKRLRDSAQLAIGGHIDYAMLITLMRFASGGCPIPATAENES